MRDPQKLIAYRKAYAFALRVHEAHIALSNSRHAGLGQQLRRAAQSVAANIAEGCGHSSRREFARFLQHAIASNVEVANHLRLGRDTNAMSKSEFSSLAESNEEVRRITAGLLRVVRDELERQGEHDDTVTSRQKRRVSKNSQR